MAMYGYIRTIREQEADRPGMNPETQRRNLLEAGVPERNIHADIDVSGVAGVATRNSWRSVDAKVGARRRLGGGGAGPHRAASLDVMGKIYDLVDRGVRLRSLADNESWAKGLDADPESMEWMTAMLIAQVCSFSAQTGAPGNCSPYPGGLGASQGGGQAAGPPAESR